MIHTIKMDANGNDFVMLNNFNLQYDETKFSKFARKVCQRSNEFGGADGVLIVEPSDICDFKMRLFNADGTEAEMCGNGARCIACFAKKLGIVSKDDIKFETLAGVIQAHFQDDEVAIELSAVEKKKIVLYSNDKVVDFAFDYAFLNTGVPHVVVFEDKHSRQFEDYEEIGRQIRNRLDLFPEGANINFLSTTDDKTTLDVYTYERGVEAMTLSCGTGSTASVLAANLRGIVPDEEIAVVNKGGINKVKILRQTEEFIYPMLCGKVNFGNEITIKENIMQKTWWRETIETVLWAVGLAFILRTFVIQAFWIPSGSMIPTLMEQDRVFVLKFLYKTPFNVEVKRGDIIVFAYPLDTKKDYIKRVVALSGEKVALKQGRLYVNDKEIPEPYVVNKDNYDFEEVTVPEDSYFCLGDNRPNSQDGRYWGFVPKKNIKGPAKFRYWPLTRIGVVK